MYYGYLWTYWYALLFVFFFICYKNIFIELIGLCFAIASIWARPFGWWRCLKLLFIRRKAGSTDFRKHKSIYIAIGLNAVCCIIDAIVTIPLAIITAIFFPFGTIHAYFIGREMLAENAKRPSNDELFEMVTQNDADFNQWRAGEAIDDLSIEQKQAVDNLKFGIDEFDKILIGHLLRFDIQYRKNLVVIFFYAIVDFFVFLMTLPALIAVWRIYGWVNIFKYHWESYKTRSYWKMRYDLFQNLFFSLSDLIILPFAIIAILLLPTKMYLLIRAWFQFLGDFALCQNKCAKSSTFLIFSKNGLFSISITKHALTYACIIYQTPNHFFYILFKL